MGNWPSKFGIAFPSANSNSVNVPTSSVSVSELPPAPDIDKNLLKELLLRMTVGGISLALSAILLSYLIKQMDPTHSQREASKKRAQQIMSELGMDGKKVKLTAHEMDIAAQLVCGQKTGVGWEEIGGCEELISQLQDSLILPLKLSSSSSLLFPPKGVLLYGPPGCGKTLLAKAVARASGAYFINLQVSSLTDKWYGESQKLAAAVFSLASKLSPSIIFIDEIDSFLRSRTSHDHEATAMMKAQFMSLWDGFASDTSTSRIVIMGATNRPEDVDKAILRRMPCRFHVKMPNELQRESVLKVILKNEKLTEDVCMKELSKEANGLSGSDLREICRLAAVQRAKDLIEQGINLSSQEAQESPLEMDHLRVAVRRVQKSQTTMSFSDRLLIPQDLPID